MYRSFDESETSNILSEVESFPLLSCITFWRNQRGKTRNDMGYFCFLEIKGLAPLGSGVLNLFTDQKGGGSSQKYDGVIIRPVQRS